MAVAGRAGALAGGFLAAGLALVAAGAAASVWVAAKEEPAARANAAATRAMRVRFIGASQLE